MKWDWLDQRIVDCGYTRLEFSKVVDLHPARLSEMITNRPINSGVIRKIPARKVSKFAELLKIEYTSLRDYNDDLRSDIVFLEKNKKIILSKQHLKLKKTYSFVKSHFIEICLLIIAISLFKLAFFNNDMDMLIRMIRRINLTCY